MNKSFSIYFICYDGLICKQAERIAMELTSGQIRTSSGAIMPATESVSRFDIARLARATIVICFAEEIRNNCPIFPPGLKSHCWRETEEGVIKELMIKLLTEYKIPISERRG